MGMFVSVDELQQKIENDPRIIEDNTGYFDDVILVDDIYDVIDKCKQYEFNEPSRKGKWLETHDNNKKRCSNCDFIFLIATYPACSADYCPHCGARMSEKVGEGDGN